MEKFIENVNMPPPSYKRKSDSSQSDNSDLDSPIPVSPVMSSFNVNLTDDDVGDAIGGSSSQQPIGVKKEKLKKKNVTTLFLNL